MPGPHDRIIADAAKAALALLQFRRKGRSRTWIADHGWWLTLVEFQPSACSRGTYLNVAAHWLWSETADLSFDYGGKAPDTGGRIAEFVEYKTDEQFAPIAACLAARTADQARNLAQTLASPSAAASALLEAQWSLDRSRTAGWMTYNAGVAAALVDRWEEAADMFARIAASAEPLGSILHPAAARMARLIGDPAMFRREVTALIIKQRAALRLPAASALPF